MKKIMWKELKEDDPIFKQGFIISQPKIQNIDLVKIQKKFLIIQERLIGKRR